MTVFVVVLQEEEHRVQEKIEEHFSNYLQYTDTFFLLESDKLTEDVAVAIGIKGEKRIAGVSGWVIKLNDFNYAGYTSRTLWEWLQEAE